MKIKFFAYIRDYTGCKETDFPYHDNLHELLFALSERYGEAMRQKVLTPDGRQLGDEIIILVNGRHVEHLGRLETPLAPTDVVSIFPVVAGG